MITFQSLWDNHPTITGDDNPCRTQGQISFSDQCAIRVGVALEACGVDTGQLPGVRHGWQHDKRSGHVLSAEDLANGIKSYPIAGIGKIQTLASPDFAVALRGRKGIIFFKDYWRRTINGNTEQFRNRSGDHIDLWNGSRLTSPGSWARIHLRAGGLGLHSFGFHSDLEDSKDIWFWQVA